MPRFFVGPVTGQTVCITGPDAHHIARVLRMKTGENLTLCDSNGTDYRCEITTVADGMVELQVIESRPTASEPTVCVTLYQGLPKSEKMEWIIQKAVEIGVAKVVPVAMARSVVKLKADEGAKKQVRWQKIAAEAAGQSGRGCVPQVDAPIAWNQLIACLGDVPTVTFYEGGGRPLRQLVDEGTRELAIVIGPEGGFEPAEIQELQEHGAQIATLGKRILRCETAPLVALSVIMELTGNMSF